MECDLYPKQTKTLQKESTQFCNRKHLKQNVNHRMWFATKNY